MQLIINTTGIGRCIYGEEIDLHALGNLTIRRASCVEPDCKGSWFADLSTIGGAKIGPCLARSEAVLAELEWLENNWLLR